MSQETPIQSTLRIALLGASRGLGAALAQHLGEMHPVLLVARKEVRLQALKERLPDAHIAVSDFSKLENGADVIAAVSHFEATHLIYCAGGGPYGHFNEKKWASHEWAYHVNFLFPAHLIYAAVNGLMPHLRQLIYVGSAIAENKPEPLGAAYAASKCAMKGLIESLQADLSLLSQSGLDLRRYSPGYIDTELIPSGSWPRHVDGLCLSVSEVASDLSLWMQDSTALSRNRVFAR